MEVISLFSEKNPNANNNKRPPPNTHIPHFVLVKLLLIKMWKYGDSYTNSRTVMLDFEIY